MKKQAAEIVRIPVEGPMARIGAAAFLAVLAFPKRKDYPKRDRLIEAAKMWITRRAVVAGYPQQLSRKRYRNFRLQEVLRAFNPTRLRIMNHRVPAAAMGHHILWHALVAVGLGKRTVPSVGDAIHLFFPDADAGSPIDNRFRQHAFERWRETAPVLHLAMALPRDKNMFELIMQPGWLAPAVHSAESLRPYLPHIVANFKLQNAVRILPNKQQH